jgi:hypothetical protein
VAHHLGAGDDDGVDTQVLPVTEVEDDPREMG